MKRLIATIAGTMVLATTPAVVPMSAASATVAVESVAAAQPYLIYRFYSDFARTQLVGESILYCDGSAFSYGELTHFYTEEYFDCAG